MNKYLDYISNCDNEISAIIKNNDEYLIKINLWDGRICHLKVINCRRLIYNAELINEIFDIENSDGVYRFMTLDKEEVILEIEADDIVIVEWDPLNEGVI